MNRLDRFRFGNLHKRRVFLVLVLILIMLIISLGFLTFIGFFGSRAELPRIRASAQLTSDRTEGVGINVIDIPDANLIDEPFFNKEDGFISATVMDAGGNYIYFDPSEAGRLSTRSVGDSISILSIDGSGNMGLRYSGRTVGFADTMFSVPVVIEDTSAMWNNDPVIKTAECSGELYLLTSSGKIISDAAILPVDESVDVPFTDIASEGINIYALTKTGDVYISADCGPFTLYGSCALSDGSEASHIACVNGNVVVFTSDGKICSVTAEGSTLTGEAEVSFVASGEGYLVFCTDNEVFVSFNGIFISKLTSVDSILREGDRITDLEAGETTAYVLTQYGKLIRINMNDTAPLTDSVDISSIEPVQICPSGNYGVIAVAADKQAYFVSVIEETPRTLGMPGVSVDDVMMFGNDKYIVRSGNVLYETSIKAAVEVDLPIADDLILEGDVCIIKSRSTNVGSWDLYGDTDLVPNDSGVSIIGSGDGLHAISRVLPGTAEELFERNLFYRIELMVSADRDDALLSMWIEGETFGARGQHAADVMTQPGSVSYVFAVTEDMLSDESLRLNISFEGEAVFNIESIYVGLDRYDINDAQSDFIDSIVESAPSALRFASTVPGSNGYCEETFYGISASSLETEMNLCKDSGANPWLVLGSAISQEDVNNIMGYLCGSVTHEYGKRRIDNGTALPWSRQFDTIYIEIGDSDGIFLSDYQRGAYVSYVINLFEKSEFYIGIKDKVVFIDGMNYEGGTVLSDADRHASGLYIDAIADENGERLPFTAAASVAVEDAVSRAPRSPSRGMEGYEYVSSLHINDSYTSSNYTSADVVAAILNAETVFTDIIMIDSDMDACRVIPTLRDLIGGGLMYCEVLDPLDTSSLYTAEYFNSSCGTMLIDSDSSIILVVANYSNTIQQFTYISDSFDTSSGSYIRYASDGRALMERDLDNFGQRQLLQAGEYMVIEVPKE